MTWGQSGVVLAQSNVKHLFGPWVENEDQTLLDGGDEAHDDFHFQAEHALHPRPDGFPADPYKLDWRGSIFIP